MKFYNKNLDYTGSSNPYALIQQAGKTRRRKYSTKYKNKNKKNKTKKIKRRYRKRT